jgi:hypothetical protein
MEDDSVQAFDDTIDERFYDERRERAQRRQRKRYHAVYVAPKWRAELPTTTNEEDSDDGESRQNRGLLLCGIYERKRDADAAADGVGELILRMFRGTDSRDGSWALAHSLPAEILGLVRSYGSAGDIELREMGPGLQKELRSCCCTMLDRERRRYANSLRYMTPSLVLKALKVAELTPVMSCAEAGVDLRALGQDELEARVSEAVAAHCEVAVPTGSDTAVATMLRDQLGALIGECEAEIQRRAEGGSFGHGSLIADGSLVEDGPGERPSLRAILADRNLVKLDRWLQGSPSPAVLARLLHQEKKFALARGNDDSGSEDDDDGYSRCSLVESTGPVCSVHVAPVAAPRGAARGRPFAILGRHDECGNGEGDDDRWRSRVLGLAFGESNVMDAVRDELLYGVKDELMGSSDWWGGMVLAPTQPWPHRVDAEAPHSVLSFYEEAVPPEVLFGAEAPPLEALASGRALRASLPENDAQEIPDTVFGGVALGEREYAMPSFPAGPRGDMHDMAQPFFVWAQHERIARGYLFGSDPHECFVDNFLTWAEPVRFHPKPKPVRKPAAKKKPARKRRRR